MIQQNSAINSPGLFPKAAKKAIICSALEEQSAASSYQCYLFPERHIEAAVVFDCNDLIRKVFHGQINRRPALDSGGLRIYIDVLEFSIRGANRRY